MTESHEEHVQQQKSAVSAPLQNRTKWIIIAGMVLIAIASVKFFMSPERALERALKDGTGDAVDVDIEHDGTINITSEDGETDYRASSGANVSLPENWPETLKLPDDARISFAGTVNQDDDTQGISVVFTIDKTPNEVVEYFTGALKADSWEITSTATMGTGSMVSATKGENGALGVYISNEGGAETSVTVTLQQPK